MSETQNKDDHARSEDADTVSMLEVLQDEQDLEEEAAAVLGATSDTECSYSKGYIARQPLYACQTCNDAKDSATSPGGVCLACSYHCHEGHSLVELYTKRMFRCDCGTERLANTCTLNQKDKQGGNKLNKYNQNFVGLYCVCARPYPDPEDTVDDCMIQCVVCEDWYHGRHLGREGGPPDPSLYAEMICLGCVKIHPFLLHYANLDVTFSGDKKEEPLSDDKKDEPETDTVDIVSVSVKDSPQEEKEALKDKPEESLEDDPVCKTSLCRLQEPLPPSVSTSRPSSLFLPGGLLSEGGWRAKLCRCPSCHQMYQDRKLSFLCQASDTVHHYEAQASKRPGVMEKGMEALGQMDRVKQVEAIQSYNSMKENLMDYLAKFASSKKVVREEDIRTFFEGNKRRRTDEGGPPPSCR